MHDWVGSPYEVTGQFHTSTRLQPPRPFLPFPLYLDTVLLQVSFVKLWLYRSFNVVGVWRLLIVIVIRIEEAKETLRRASFQTPLQDEFSKKKMGKNWKPFFLPNSQSRVPGPSTESVFVQIILPFKWTGVSLKGSRWNWQETAPGEEKVNQLFNTNCNKWHFNRFLKDVEQSIIHFYL
jgi:hypothetical protein